MRVAKFTLHAVLLAGLTEAQVEDFVSEHVSHTIRRRNIVGGGVLQVGDARIDADSIEINVDQDTEDGWFGEFRGGCGDTDTRLNVRRAEHVYTGLGYRKR